MLPGTGPDYQYTHRPRITERLPAERDSALDPRANMVALTGSASRHPLVHDGWVIVAHRGACGYRPEHTSAAYELAYRMGADWVDVDLVPTSDGHLVARHENEIGRTTDVADHPEFAARWSTKVVDGVEVTGWFTEDFTLAELKTLRARERIPHLRPSNTLYNGRYEVLTLPEVLDLTARLGTELGRTLGTFPEVKHSAYFASLGLPTEPVLVATLRRYRLDRPDAPVVIQSFEASSLRTLREHLDVALLRIVQFEDDRVDDIATYADYIGPEKKLVIGRDATDSLAKPTTLVDDAHAAGLRVAPWTFRNENAFLPADLRSGTEKAAVGDAFAEYDAYRDAGVDLFFTDNPDTALEAVSACHVRVSAPREPDTRT